jgi:hypothetical protein
MTTKVRTAADTGKNNSIADVVSSKKGKSMAPPVQKANIVKFSNALFNPVITARKQNDHPEEATAQRAPADFVGHTVLDQPSVTGIFRTSFWEPLRVAVTAYSVINQADIKGRKKLLREIGVFAQRWRIARGLPAKPLTDLDDVERAKVAALNALEVTLQAEKIELAGGDGNLVVANPGLGHVEAEPELTSVRKESDGRKRGYFIGNTNVVNALNANVGNVAARTVCRVTETTVGPAGQDARRYYAVRPAPGSDSTYGTVVDFTPGFVLRSEIMSINLDNPETKKLKYEDRFSPVLHPLFQGTPSVEDVQQGSLGDCYLLAAVMAIVRLTPNHFPNHMVDHGDGVVSVRLYEKTGVGTYQAKTVHVRKSVVVKKSATTTLEEGYTKGAIWVQLLEKAYIAANFQGDTDDNLPSLRRSWAQLASGHSKHALAHLTGTAAVDHHIQSVDPQEFVADSNWAGIGGHALFGHLWTNHRPLALELNADGVRDTFGERVAALKNAHDEVRINDVEELVVNGMGFSGPLSTEIMNFIRPLRIYPEKRGKGKYTEAQLNAFRAVVNGVDAGSRVVAASRSHMKRGNNNHDGHSGGENVHGGLAGPHGYEVIAYNNSGLDPLNPTTDTICWVQVRNPWGRMGRVYRDTEHDVDVDQHQLLPVGEKLEDREGENPEFWLPLEDFTKRFSMISVG